MQFTSFQLIWLLVNQMATKLEASHFMLKESIYVYERDV